MPTVPSATFLSRDSLLCPSLKQTATASPPEVIKDTLPGCHIPSFPPARPVSTWWAHCRVTSAPRRFQLEARQAFCSWNAGPTPGSGERGPTDKGVLTTADSVSSRNAFTSSAQVPRMWQAPRFLGQWSKFPESSIPASHIPSKYSKSFLAEEFWESIKSTRGYAGHTKVLFLSQSSS